MYARIVDVPLLSEAIAEATRYFRDSVGPALKAHAGFVSSRLLIDAPNSRCLMLTAWESAQARTEAEANGFLQEVLNNMKPYFGGPPTIAYYEIPVEVD